MGTVDDYLRYQVTPQLRPGEQIMGMGLVRQPTKFNLAMNPERWDEWLATATNRRLILFKTETSGSLTLNPRPTCQEVCEWHYQDLARVEVAPIGGLVNGLTMSFAPRDGMGPRQGTGARYDVWPKVENLDAHADFFQRFPYWLSQQVAAGAFPLDQEGMARAQAIAMQRQQQAALAQQQQAMAAQQRAAQVEKGKQAMRGPLPWLVGAGILFLGALLAGVFVYDALESASKYERMTKACRSEAKARDLDADVCDSTADLADSATASLPIRGGAAVVLLAGAATLLVLGLKKRKA